MESKYENSRFVFVVGIGGSDLASKAIWNAITLHKKTDKKLFFLESPDSREYEEIENFVKNEIVRPEDIVLIVVSKSGETRETLEAFHKIYDILSEKFSVSKTPFEMPRSKKGVFDTLNERALVISSPNSILWNLAGEKNMERIPWEGNVGGRFSAFTVAHTAVLKIAGLSESDFILGGKEMKSKEGEEKAEKIAQKIFENYEKGVDILDFFIFNSELEDLGKWCRQLLAESLGKEDKKGEKVGITPTVSIGPTDLHSMLQLDLGGPKNKFTIFIKSSKEIKDSINEEAYENTIKAYEKNSLPFEKYEIAEINEYELGKFMELMMQITVKLAKFLGVDPFDQPAVEEYKAQIKKT